jgi:hypothetical protein
MGNTKTLDDAGHHKIRYRETQRKSANAVDATGWWFVVAALSAFLIAGVLVYRGATADVAVSATRPISVAATSSPVGQPPLHAHLEGVDP